MNFIPHPYPPSSQPHHKVPSIKLALEAHGPAEQDGPFVRVQLPKEMFSSAMALLRTRALELYQMNHCVNETQKEKCEVYFTYRDSEGDTCVISTEEDLRSALIGDNPVLKILARVVQPLSPPVVASTSTQSNTMQQNSFANMPVHKIVENLVGVLAVASIALQKHVRRGPTTVASSQPCFESVACAPTVPLRAPASDTPAPLATSEDSRPFIHGRHTCDACLTTPIVGKRFHAVNLPDYDLCAACKDIYKGSEIRFEEAELDRDRPMQDRWARRFAKFNKKMEEQEERLARQQAHRVARHLPFAAPPPPHHHHHPHSPPHHHGHLMLPPFHHMPPRLHHWHPLEPPHPSGPPPHYFCPGPLGHPVAAGESAPDIIVKCFSGKTFELRGVDMNGTIGDLKNKIRDEKGIDAQRLIFNGDQYADDEILAQCGVRKGSIVSFALRAPDSSLASQTARNENGFSAGPNEPSSPGHAVAISNQYTDHALNEAIRRSLQDQKVTNEAPKTEARAAERMDSTCLNQCMEAARNEANEAVASVQSKMSVEEQLDDAVKEAAQATRKAGLAIKNAVRTSLRDVKYSARKIEKEVKGGLKEAVPTLQEVFRWSTPRSAKKGSVTTAADNTSKGETETKNVTVQGTVAPLAFSDGTQSLAEESFCVKETAATPTTSNAEFLNKETKTKDSTAVETVVGEGEVVVPPEAPVGSYPMARASISEGGDWSAAAEVGVEEESFENEAEGNGEVAIEVGKAMDALATAINDISVALSSKDNISDDASENSDLIFVDTTQEPAGVGAMIDKGGEKEDEESRGSWDVVDDELPPCNEDEALGRAAQAIGSALFESGTGPQPPAPTGNASILSLGSGLVSTNLPPVSPPLPTWALRWAKQLEKLHEIGFHDDDANLEIMERLEAASVNEGTYKEITVEHVLNELMKSW